MKTSALCLFLLLMFSCKPLQSNSADLNQVNLFLDQWHLAATNADYKGCWAPGWKVVEGRECSLNLMGNGKLNTMFYRWPFPTTIPTPWFNSKKKPSPFYCNPSRLNQHNKFSARQCRVVATCQASLGSYWPNQIGGSNPNPLAHSYRQYWQANCQQFFDGNQVGSWCWNQGGVW